MRKKLVLVAIADGSEEFEAIGIVDPLRRAGADVILASVSGLQITASQGTRITADKLISECKEMEFDLIALPGGMPGARNLRNNEILTNLLKKQAKTGKLYAAICASPFIVLQYHGLLAGKKATCHPAFANRLNNKEAIYKRVSIDGNCITSQGPGTVLEFSYTLIKELFDEKKAKLITDPMLLCARC